MTTTRSDQHGGLSRRTFLQAAAAVTAAGAFWEFGPGGVPQQAAALTSGAQVPRILIEDNFNFPAHVGYVQPSGWDDRQAGGLLNYGQWLRVRDTTGRLPVSLARRFAAQSGGDVALDFRVVPLSTLDGARWELRNGTSALVVLSVASNALRLEHASGTTPLATLATNVEIGVRIVAHLDTRTTDVYVNGSAAATAAGMTGSGSTLDNLLVSTGASQVNDMQFGPVRLSSGFALNESFVHDVAGALGSPWTASGAGASLVALDTGDIADKVTMSLDATAGAANASASVVIGPENLGIEFAVHSASALNGTTVAVLADLLDLQLRVTSGVWEVLDDNGAWRSLRAATTGIWQQVRVRLDIAGEEARISINGKVCATALPVHLSSTSAPTASIAFAAPTGTVVRVDDVKVFTHPDEPADYPAAPTVVGTPGVLVGMQEFSGWREGHHIGWDTVKAYPSRMPLLGTYDEGSPEVSDWEIKWMVENGVAFRLYCWFRPSPGKGTPIRSPYLGHALHDGFFEAKYSPLMKFAIMWENQNGGNTDSADFRQNVVPFWIDYYFTDPRYLVIDNKPVLSIYRNSRLGTIFGSVAAATDEIDFLRAAVQSAGFDDILLLTTTADANAATMGFDAEYIYTRQSGNFTAQRDTLLALDSASTVGAVASVGMGYDAAPWGARPGLSTTPAAFTAMAEWIRDTYLPGRTVGDVTASMVLLDNWNEFAEGHYLMPAQSNGFAFMNAIRATFGTGPFPSNVTPTTAQKERVSLLYPPSRTVRTLERTAPPLSTTYTYDWDFSADEDGWTVDKQVTGLAAAGSILSGSATGADPGLLSPDVLGLEAADHPWIRIRMKSAPSTGGELFFITAADGAWSESKGISFHAEPDTSGYGIVDIPMWKVPTWKGTIRQIRFDPTVLFSPATFEVDYIRVLNVPQATPLLRVSGIRDRYEAPSLPGTVPLVPGEYAFRALGWRTEFDAAAYAINALSPTGDLIRVGVGNSTGYLNGVPFAMSAAPAWIGQRVLVPYSLFTAAGYTATWNATAGTVDIA
ncbi:twin-arginine translocation signal domain-containing protein [Microbacterium sp. CFH 90308]|uniref:Twin-arginine translocation signal domain-containing protein n=1 Tax=Microbacterium salsuginis TaxID=2722803 RepID=A0ABX1KDM0_9MICO|nr:glycoside hydrolase family 99-like domain-containing protein [Microbacterium sp. CFH 90308]NLP84174.1 twin-arginine translocation signal domain-containing protein [Microbacterium sp. CFH 90308]